MIAWLATTAWSQVTVTIAPASPEYAIGEAIWLVVTVDNHGDEPFYQGFQYSLHDRTLTARVIGPDGVAAPDPGRYPPCGISENAWNGVDVAPGATGTYRVDLARYAWLDRPGTWQVTLRPLEGQPTEATTTVVLRDPTDLRAVVETHPASAGRTRSRATTTRASGTRATCRSSRPWRRSPTSARSAASQRARAPRRPRPCCACTSATRVSRPASTGIWFVRATVHLDPCPGAGVPVGGAPVRTPVPTDAGCDARLPPLPEGVRVSLNSEPAENGLPIFSYNGPLAPAIAIPRRAPRPPPSPRPDAPHPPPSRDAFGRPTEARGTARVTVETGTQVLTVLDVVPVRLDVDPPFAVRATRGPQVVEQRVGAEGLELQPGRWRIAVLQGDEAGVVTVDVTVALPDPVPVRLGPAPVVSGRLVDALGRPVWGASVRVGSWSGSTDPAGRFRIPVPDPDVTYAVTLGRTTRELGVGDAGVLRVAP